MELRHRIRSITEDTLVPLSLVAILAGGITWLTTLYVKAEDTAKAVERIEAKQEVYLQNVQEINVRLSRIEGRLGIDNHR